MARSTAKTVEGYLRELPADRRAVIAAVRAVILKHLPKGYQESVEWGFPCYEIPLAKYPDTYNKRPLMYAAIAAQKNFYALYLTGSYGEPKQVALVVDAFKKAGKKLDAGKSVFDGHESRPGRVGLHFRSVVLLRQSVFPRV